MNIFLRFRIRDIQKIHISVKKVVRLFNNGLGMPRIRRRCGLRVKTEDDDEIKDSSHVCAPLLLNKQVHYSSLTNAGVIRIAKYETHTQTLKLILWQSFKFPAFLLLSLWLALINELTSISLGGTPTPLSLSPQPIAKL